jgi:hypothetical protein
LENFSKNPQISNFMKISPVCAQFFHAEGQSDGRIDMKKLIVARPMQFSEGSSELAIGWRMFYVKGNSIVCVVHQTLLEN